MRKNIMVLLISTILSLNCHILEHTIYDFDIQKFSFATFSHEEQSVTFTDSNGVEWTVCVQYNNTDNSVKNDRISNGNHTISVTSVILSMHFCVLVNTNYIVQVSDEGYSTEIYQVVSDVLTRVSGSCAKYELTCVSGFSFTTKWLKCEIQSDGTLTVTSKL